MSAQESHPGPLQTVADLHLPPTFVVDHVIRLLSYQGALTPVEVAQSMHVHDSIAIELLESLRSAGVVQLDTGHANFDRLGRVRLSDSGQARVALARQRTWYAGPLPVSLADFAGRAGTSPAQPGASPEAFRAKLDELDVGREAADAIGQAIAAAATICIDGVADDEQMAIAAALGGALTGTVTLPYALFAAGSVVRLFDPQHHHAVEERRRDDDGLDVLRSTHDATQWAIVERPSVALTGGILASDVVPAYDEDARFYIAPTPLTAVGGLLTITDAAANPGALIDLARLWLTSGRHHTGILLLRSGERIEVPWRTATALTGVAPEQLPGPARRAIGYAVDLGEIAGETLLRFLTRRLDEATFPAQAIGALASRIEGGRLTRRQCAAAACAYLRDRAAYEGDGFSVTDDVLDQAVSSAARAARSVAGVSRLRAA